MVNGSFTRKCLVAVCLLATNFNATIKFCGNRSTLALDKANSTLTLATSLTGFDGTLKLRSTSTATNVNSATGAETISFSGGSLQVGTNIVDLSGGSYDPKTSAKDVLTLSTGQIMSVSAGTTIFHDVLVANGQNATIIGTPTFSGTVSLGNSSSVLNLGLQHKLNQDLILNSGKIVLTDDLSLQDGVRLWGPGTVDINNQSIALGAAVNSSIWTKNLTFWRAKDLQLNGSMVLAGKWSFLTDSGANESILNGNGNVLTLTGPGKIVVGDASAGHTLYITDLHIKGLSDAAYTVPGLSKAQYAALSGLAGGTVTAGNLAYDEDYVALGTGPSTLVNWDSIAVYDDPTLAAPYVFGVTKGNVLGGTTLNSGPTTVTNLDGAVTANVDVDAGTDGVYAWVNNTTKTIKLYTTSAATIRTTTSGNTTFRALAVGSVNNIYTVRTDDLTQVCSYSGTPDTWNDSWATGYTGIIDIAASNDGYVWVLDSTGLYKTNGGAKSGATVITLPETSTTYGSALASRNAIAIKGSSTNLFGAYCGASGKVYFTVDGTTFSELGAFGATGVAVGAQGTLAFTSPNDSSLPGYATGLGVFVRASGNNVFSLYGSATDANRGKVILSNVTMELKRNYTHSAGRITVKGDNCTLISGGTKTFNVANNTSTDLEVDSVALIYETLAGPNVNPFASSPKALTLTNGGVVRSAIFQVAPVDLTIDANGNLTYGPLTKNYTLFGNYSDHSGRINITNSDPGNAKTITLDGGNYFWQFPSGTTKVLLVANNVALTLTNVVLKGFSLNNVTLGTSASLTFGDGVVIELDADQTLAAGQSAFACNGNVIIRGRGQTITLSANSSMTQAGAGKTLTLDNAVVKSSTATSMACSNATAKIAMTNSSLLINQAGFTFATGNMDINGYTKIGSIRSDSSGAVANFNLTTAGAMAVTTGSTLELGRAINFVYNPNTTGDVGGATGSAAKRHFTIGLSGDSSPTLYCNNCSIDATGIGLALDRGNLLVDNKVNITASSTANYESELGSALNVEVLAAGSLNLDGGIKYTSTTV